MAVTLSHIWNCWKKGALAGPKGKACETAAKSGGWCGKAIICAVTDNVIWLNHGSRLIRATLEHARFASPGEQLNWSEVSRQMTNVHEHLQGPHELTYVDLLADPTLAQRETGKH